MQDVHRILVDVSWIDNGWNMEGVGQKIISADTDTTFFTGKFSVDTQIVDPKTALITL